MKRYRIGLPLLLAAGVWMTAFAGAVAQEKGGKTKADRDEAAKRAEKALAAPGDAPAPKPQVNSPPPDAQPPNLFALWWKGGMLMYPITGMSVIAGIFAIERLLALRRGRVIPSGLVNLLGEMSAKPGGIDPRQAYKLCQQFPSTAANVFRSVLLKVGRPHAEVEHTVEESSEREAARLYKNVRPITLAVSVTPLLGLLGTVQGMIECFYRTANLPVGANRTEALANGIYIALVTTFGGLVVAIPAAVIAHYFEGVIQARFREIDELVQGLLPQLERYEGKLRIGRAAEHAPPSEPPLAEVAPAKPERVRG